MDNCDEDCDEAFCCPITLEQFTDPIIIPECGHTFDRRQLKDCNKKECPKCRKPFRGDPSGFPTNWSIVEYLDLNIKSKTVPDTVKYSAKHAKKDTKRYTNASAQIIIDCVLQKISDKAKTGSKELTIYLNDYFNDFGIECKKGTDVYARIIKILKKKGYKLSYDYTFAGVGKGRQIVDGSRIIISW
jgi:hypothetical protein